MIPADDIVGAEGFIIPIGTIDVDVIAFSPCLKVIGCPGVGYDNTNIEAATAAGISVGIKPRCK